MVSVPFPPRGQLVLFKTDVRYLTPVRDSRHGGSFLTVPLMVLELQKSTKMKPSSEEFMT